MKNLIIIISLFMLLTIGCLEKEVNSEKELYIALIRDISGSRDRDFLDTTFLRKIFEELADTHLNTQIDLFEVSNKSAYPERLQLNAIPAAISDLHPNLKIHNELRDSLTFVNKERIENFLQTIPIGTKVNPNEPSWTFLEKTIERMLYAYTNDDLYHQRICLLNSDLLNHTPGTSPRLIDLSVVQALNDATESGARLFIVTETQIDSSLAKLEATFLTHADDFFRHFDQINK